VPEKAALVLEKPNVGERLLGREVDEVSAPREPSEVREQRRVEVQAVDVYGGAGVVQERALIRRERSAAVRLPQESPLDRDERAVETAACSKGLCQAFGALADGFPPEALVREAHCMTGSGVVVLSRWLASRGPGAKRPVDPSLVAGVASELAGGQKSFEADRVAVPPERERIGEESFGDQAQPLELRADRNTRHG
jgi:hypothetical protein